MTTEIAVSAYKKLVDGISRTFERARDEVVANANTILTRAYWEIGKQISQVEQKNELRAEYGEGLIEKLSEDLSEKFGRGFSDVNLRRMRKFYQQNRIQSTSTELSWSQNVALLPIEDKNVRNLLGKQAVKNNWSSRELLDEVRKARGADIRRNVRRSKSEKTADTAGPAAGEVPQLKPPVRGDIVHLQNSRAEVRSRRRRNGGD
ncbi:MAG: DUF1016 N-terminal domain-containing protein [Methanobacteriota archaeon]